MKHCDDYIDDETQPTALRRFLDRARSPAHGMTDSSPYPELYADHNGIRIRVTMASRFGDVGITSRLSNCTGYELRVSVESLSNFSESP